MIENFSIELLSTTYSWTVQILRGKIAAALWRASHGAIRIAASDFRIRTLRGGCRYGLEVLDHHQLAQIWLAARVTVEILPKGRGGGSSVYSGSTLRPAGPLLTPHSPRGPRRAGSAATRDAAAHNVGPRGR